MGFLRDPVWQFAGALVALLAIGVSILIARRQRQMKRLSHSLRSTELISVKNEVCEKIRIFYLDRPVRDVRLVELSLRNSGTVPIEPQDFVSPLSLQFGKEGQVLSAEVSETDPPDLGATLEPTVSDATVPPDAVTLSPILLNPGDSLRIKLLTAASEDPRLTARISGVSRIEKEQPRFLRRAFFSGMLVGVLSGFVAGAGALYLHRFKTTFFATLGVIMAIALFAIAVVFWRFLRVFRAQESDERAQYKK